MNTRWLLALCLGMAAACGDDDSSDDGQAGSGGDGEPDSGQENPPATFESQVAEGGELYGEYCAECHGDSGEGIGAAPKLVGEGKLPREPPASRTLRTEEFRTALDVYGFVSENMPGDDPGSLSAEQYVSILAFALSANGVELDAPLDADSAAELVINPP